MVSVIVPVYNCMNYLERCVNSILAQSYKEFEVILVDDGSTDGSGGLCDELSRKESKIKVIHQTNRGVSAARNAGINISEGKYLAFVDADDELPPYAFEALISATILPAELYLGSCLAIGTHCEPNFMFGAEKEYSKEELAYATMCIPKTRLLMSGVWGKLFLAKIIKDNLITFSTKLQNGEDGLFIAEYLKYVERAINIRNRPPIYYLYRYGESERVSAVSAFYPDFFEFHIMHSEKLYGLISCDSKAEACIDFFYHFIDELIKFLVWAYAYSDFFERGVLIEKLIAVMENQLVRQAIKGYKRKNRAHSVKIPLAIRTKNIDLLRAELELRAKEYNEKNIKSTLIKSIYRMTVLTEKEGATIE